MRNCVKDEINKASHPSRFKHCMAPTITYMFDSMPELQQASLSPVTNLAIIGFLPGQAYLAIAGWQDEIILTAAVVCCSAMTAVSTTQIASQHLLRQYGIHRGQLCVFDASQLILLVCTAGVDSAYKWPLQTVGLPSGRQ